MSRIFISAAHKSSGKTTISIGLCAALSQRKYAIAPFKKGPDYIDPMWLGKATQHACVNLDFYTMQASEIIARINQAEQQQRLVFIEGNKGLYDGLDLDGSNSNAALATLTQTPVILVINVQGMTRGIAPLILGYQAFDRQVNIAGVILNQFRGVRHEQKLQNVIEHYTDVPVIGAVRHDPALEITERHLGLVPSNENDDATKKINTIASAISEQVDIDQLIRIADTAPELPLSDFQPTAYRITRPLRIGIMRDAAFGFYYPDDLDEFTQCGAELVDINALKDNHLPDIDGLFIGGGFPETQLMSLSANQTLLTQVRDAIENGLPAYAECGGLMYLCKTISWQGKTLPMAGVINADCIMHSRPQGRGYVLLRETGNTLWPHPVHGTIPAHEFHYSGLENLAPDTQFAYETKRGTGIDGRHDGIVYKNLLANYTHFRHTSQHHWVHRFLAFVESRTTV